MLGLGGFSFADAFKKNNDSLVIAAFNKEIAKGASSQKAYSNALRVTKKSIDDVSSTAHNLMKHSKNGAVSMEAYSKSITKIGASTQIAAIGLKALTAVVNMTLTGLISFGLSKALEALDNYIHKQDILEEKLQNSKSSYQETVSKITSLNEELSGVNSQIAAIQAQGTLSITDENQLKLLQDEKKELEELLNIEKALQNIAYSEVKKDAYNVLKDKYSGDGFSTILNALSPARLQAMIYDPDAFAGIGHYEAGADTNNILAQKFNLDESFEAQSVAIRVLKTEREKVMRELNDALRNGEDTEVLETRLRGLGDTIDQATIVLRDAYVYYEEQLNGLSRVEGEYLSEQDKVINAAFDTMDQLKIAVIEAEGGNALKASLSIVKNRYSEGFDEIKNYIKENGDISKELLQQMFPDIVDALSEYGWSSDQIAKQLNIDYSPANAVDNSLITNYESFVDTLFDTTNASKALNEALSEQLESGSLSAETFEKLVRTNANFANFLERTATGYSLNIDAVNEYIAAQKELDKGLAISRIMELQELLADPTLSGETKTAYQTEIVQLQMLVDQIDLATGAYTRYAQAKSTANQDAMYQTGTAMYKDYKDAYNQGKTGTDDFQASVAFALGEDWESTYTNRDEAYKAALQKLKKYFGNEDERKNALNFLNELVKQGFVNDDGNYIEGVTIEAIASKLGTSNDFIRSMIGLLETYELGPEIDFTIDESDKSLAEKAQEVSALKAKVESLQTEITARRAQLDSATGEDGSPLTEQQITDIIDQLTRLEAQKAEIERLLSEGSGGAPEGALTVDAAIERLTALKDITDSFANDGIEIPITLGGEWEKLSWFLGANGVMVPGNSPTNYNGYIDTRNGSIKSVDTNGTASQLFADQNGLIVEELYPEYFDQPFELPVEPTVSEESLQSMREQVAAEPIEVPVVPKETETPLTPIVTSAPIFNKPDTSTLPSPATVAAELQLNIGSIEEQTSEIEDNLVLEAQVELADGSTETFDVQSIAAPLSKAANEAVQQVKQAGDATPELLAAASNVQSASTEVANAVIAFNSAESMTASEMQSAAQNVLTSCSNLASAYSNLQGLMNSSGMVTITADTSAAQSAIDRLQQTVRVTVKTVTVQENAKGTSYAKAGASLVDEEGAELIEHKRTGTYELGTNNGARLTQLEAGDVVHTAEETKKILGRKALVGGAFASGLSGSITSAIKKLNSLIGSSSSKSSTKSSSSASNKTTSSSSKSNSKSSSSASTKKSSSSKKVSSSKIKKYLNSLENLFDWIEIRLERLQSITDGWVRSAAEAVGYVSKNSSLDKALKNVAIQINESNQAYNKYMSQANAIAKNLNLDSSVISGIQNGTINISSYNETNQKKIKAYQEWYEKALAVKDALADLKDQQKEIATSKLDNIINHYQWQIDRIDSVLDYNSAFIDLKGATGKEIFAEDYADSIDATTEKIGKLNTQRTNLANEFKKMVKAGYVLEGSEQWYEYQSQLDELDVVILETSQSLQELIDLSNQVTLTNLQYALSVLEHSATEVANLMDLHEAQGADHSESDYESLIQNGMEQIDNLKAQNAELKKQQQGLDIMSEKYQDLQEQINSNNDAIIDMMVSQEQWNDAVLDLRITEIQKFKDELSKVNDQYERQQALQQAIENLERAKTQRTVKTYVEGEGWVYRADQNALQDAQKAFDQAIHNETMHKLDDLIDAVEDLKNDSNVYTSSGTLLGKEYTLPSFVGYTELLNSIGGTNIVSSAMDDAKKAAYEQVMGSVINSGATTSLSIGDIIVNGVDNPDALAEALLAEFPNAMLKAMHNKL